MALFSLGGGQRGRPGNGGRTSWVPSGRFTAGLGVAVVAIVIAAIALTPGGPAKGKQEQPHEQAHKAKPSLTTGRGVAANRGRVDAVRAVEAGLYPWQLQAPISREVLVPEVGQQGLTVAGGLVANGSSAAGAFRLDTGTGKLAAAGSLATATHDAAATVVDGQVLVFGGATNAPAATTQDITASGSSHILGSLPRPSFYVTPLSVSIVSRAPLAKRASARFPTVPARRHAFRGNVGNVWTFAPLSASPAPAPNRPTTRSGRQPPL